MSLSPFLFVVFFLFFVLLFFFFVEADLSHLSQSSQKFKKHRSQSKRRETHK